MESTGKSKSFIEPRRTNIYIGEDKKQSRGSLGQHPRQEEKSAASILLSLQVERLIEGNEPETKHGSLDSFLIKSLNNRSFPKKNGVSPQMSRHTGDSFASSSHRSGSSFLSLESWEQSSTHSYDSIDSQTKRTNLEDELDDILTKRSKRSNSVQANEEDDPSDTKEPPKSAPVAHKGNLFSGLTDRFENFLGGGSKKKHSADSDSFIMMGTSISTSPNQAAAQQEPKRRHRITRDQQELLEHVFESTTKPSSEVRQNLAERLGMSPRRVQIWFQNKRAKLKKQNQGPPTLASSSNQQTTSISISPPPMQHSASLSPRGPSSVFSTSQGSFSSLSPTSPYPPALQLPSAYQQPPYTFQSTQPSNFTTSQGSAFTRVPQTTFPVPPLRSLPQPSPLSSGPESPLSSMISDLTINSPRGSLSEASNSPRSFLSDHNEYQSVLPLRGITNTAPQGKPTLLPSLADLPHPSNNSYSKQKPPIDHSTTLPALQNNTNKKISSENDNSKKPVGLSSRDSDISKDQILPSLSSQGLL